MSAANPEDLAAYLAAPAGVEPLAFAHASAFVNTEVCPREAVPWLQDAAARVPVGLSILKYGSRSIVGSHEAGGIPVVFKYYLPSGFVKHFTYGLRGSRCRISWTAALAFRFIGVPTPAPLMIAEWRRLGGAWLDKSFLATTRAEGETLRKFTAARSEDDPLLARVADELKHAFAIMARFRAVHGDLKENNIIVAADGSISFIDLDAAAVLLPAAEWEQRREKDRRRFFKNWNDDPRAARLFAHAFEP